jgi:glycosyltransferase involved in cell wall biosynthesis
MTLLRHGVDYDFFDKEFNNIGCNNLKLIFPAQFRLGKNQDSIIKAFAQYCEQANDTISELYLPGDGDLKKSCEELAYKSKAKNQIFFPGLLKKEDVRIMIERCNIGVISSNSETFGAAIVEPFVLGRCVITRKVGIAPDIITDGLNGFFFKDVKELKDILIKLSRNRNLIKEIGDNNFKSRDVFRWSNSSKEYSKIIKQLLTQ